MNSDFAKYMIDVSVEFGEMYRHSWYTQLVFDPQTGQYYGYSPALCAADVGREWTLLGKRKEDVIKELDYSKRI